MVHERKSAIAAGIALFLLAALVLLTWAWRPPGPGPPPEVAKGRSEAPEEPPPRPARAIPAAGEAPVAGSASAPAVGTPGPLAEDAGGGHRPQGTVLDADRRPVKDALVSVSLDGRILAAVRTGPDGTFLLPPVRIEAENGQRFVITFLAKDGRGRTARLTARFWCTFEPGEEKATWLDGLHAGSLVLRDAAALDVRVTAGGRPAEGVPVWAEEETSYHSTGAVATDDRGRAHLDDIPVGRWTVFAKAPGCGAGRGSVRVPTGEVLEIPLSTRSLDVEAVDAATGKPVEGVRFLVAERRSREGQRDWRDFFPPLAFPPTDSAGRTRIPDLGEVEVRLTPILPGFEEPPEGTPSVEADAIATTVRVPFHGLRVLRWSLGPGERNPPEGARLVVGEERLLVHPDIPRQSPQEFREGRVEKGEVVVEGLGWGTVDVAALAPDGSLARLFAEAGCERGDPVRFRAPRRLTVVVKDEDGRPVARDVVALQRASGEAMAQPEVTDAEGKVVFAGIYPGEALVCPLASSEYDGVEGPIVDLDEGDRTAEAVVGREFPLVLRFREGGRAHLPPKFGLGLLFPGTDFRGEPRGGDPRKTGEDPDRGEVRLLVRAHAPGKPVVLLVTIPGRDPIRRDVAPPEKGAEATVEIDQ